MYNEDVMVDLLSWRGKLYQHNTVIRYHDNFPATLIRLHSWLVHLLHISRVTTVQ